MALSDGWIPGRWFLLIWRPKVGLSIYQWSPSNPLSTFHLSVSQRPSMFSISTWAINNCPKIYFNYAFDCRLFVTNDAGRYPDHICWCTLKIAATCKCYLPKLCCLISTTDRCRSCFFLRALLTCSTHLNNYHPTLSRIFVDWGKICLPHRRSHST